MAVRFEHTPHPRVESRRAAGPPRAADVARSLNGRIALILTRAVGSMWCA